MALIATSVDPAGHVRLFFDLQPADGWAETVRITRAIELALEEAVRSEAPLPLAQAA